MSTFMRRLEKDADIDPDRYDRNKYVGDGFEFFVELFLYLHPCDNRVGVYDYHVEQENDNGVDGTGVNIRGEKSVVQVKYRTNTQSFLTANVDHLSNMISDGLFAYGVGADLAHKNNFRHYIFTTAESLNFYTDQEMYKSKVKCFGYQDFRLLLDLNVPFWQSALEICEKLTKDFRNGDK
jgi:hypothetical protein